jgi:hypothetical protein
MKQLLIMLMLAIIFTALGVRMFQLTLEPALRDGHERMIERFAGWGYSHD